MKIVDIPVTTRTAPYADEIRTLIDAAGKAGEIPFRENDATGDGTVRLLRNSLLVVDPDRKYSLRKTADVSAKTLTVWIVDKIDRPRNTAV